MIDDLTERIRQVMQEYGYTPSVFADEIGVQRPAISHILSGRNRASLDVVIKILKAFSQIDSHWLLTGEGQMKQLDLFGEQEEEKKDLKNSIPPSAPASNSSIADNYVRKDMPAEESNHKIQDNPRAEDIKEPALPSEPVPVAPPPLPPPLSAPPPTVSNTESEEKKQVKPKTNETEKSDNQEKVIEKMIVFYTDKSFAVYKPE